MYVITDYSKQQAKKLGVDLRQSSNPKKKIDIYKTIPLRHGSPTSSVAVGETKQRNNNFLLIIKCQKIATITH
jgi:hypothetical protein